MTEAEWLTSDDPVAMLHCLTGSAQGHHYFPTDRKLRLFAVALCRAVENGRTCRACSGGGKVIEEGEADPDADCLHCNGSGRVGGMTDPRSRAAVDVAERFADGLATEEERDLASRAAAIVQHDDPKSHAAASRACATCADPRLSVFSATLFQWMDPEFGACGDVGAERFWSGLGATQAALLRCIFGNPWKHRGDWYKGAPEHGIKSLPPKWLYSILAHNHGAVPKLARTIYDGRRFELMPLLADELEQAGCEDAAILSHCRTPGEHVRGCHVIDLLLGKE